MKKCDYHVHPNFSIDAENVTVYDYCVKALQLEISELCFTTHFEIDPERSHLDNFIIVNGKRVSAHDLYWVDKYFEEIEKAKEIFKNYNLTIKTGIEVGYDLGLEKDIAKVVNTYPFDYVLGAIHCLKHIAISSKRESGNYFTKYNLTEMRDDYFKILDEAVNSDLFDCIAHVDLYSRYAGSYYGPDAFKVHRGYIETIFEKMAEKQMGLEINTSSLRRGLQEYHPSREIFELALKSGMNIFTVGSDAHRLSELGYYIDEALDFLQEYGITNCIYNKRKAFYSD